MRISDWSSDVCSSDLPLSFSGGATPMSLKYGSDFVAASYRVQPNIAVKDSDVVFVGYGINAPEKGWNDYAGVAVKGKTVVILVNDPDWQTKEVKGELQGRAMTKYGRSHLGRTREAT